MANADSFNAFPSAKLENLVALELDHYSIFLDRRPIVRPQQYWHNFRFENDQKL